MPILKCLDGALAGQEFALSAKATTIGRDPACVINAKDGRLSRQHAAVIYKDGRAVIRDNKSSNGTYLNGFRIPALETRQIFPGDDLRIGHLLLRYLESEIRLKADAIQNYEILDIVDEDRSTVSFHAKQEALDKDVMLVLLRPALAADKKARNQFLEEARTAATLDHPNIVHITDISDNPARLYYIREWISTPPLSYAMCMGLKARTVAIMAKHIASALDHAHEKGILHGNLNPSWIHVSGKGEIMLRGTGVSHRFDEDDARMPYYLAPEQIERRPIDGRTDIYALGSILYQALAGSTVFDGITGDEVRTKILHAIPAPLSAEAADCPSGLCDIIDRTLHRDPAERFQTAGELCDALEAYLTGAPIQTAAEENQEDIEAVEDAEANEVEAAPAKVRASSKTVVVRKKTQTSKISKRSTSGRSSNTGSSSRASGKKDDSLLKVGIGLVAAVIVAIVGFTVLQPESEEENKTDPNGTVTAKPHPDTLFRQAQQSMDDKDYAAAQVVYERILRDYPGNALITTRAKGALDKLQMQTALESKQDLFDKRMSDYEAAFAADPSAIDKHKAMLAEIKETFPDYARTVDIEIAKLGDAQTGQISALRNAVNTALRNGEFDKATSLVDQFKTQSPNHPDIEEVDEIRAKIKEDFERTDSYYKKILGEQYRNQMYAQMFATFKEMREKFKHRETLALIAVTEKKIHKILATKYKPLEDQLKILIGKRAYSDATELLQNERPAFFGTSYEEQVEQLSKALSGANRLHLYVIKEMSSNDPRPLPTSIRPPAVERLAERGTVMIHKANLETISVQANGIGARVEWDELTRPQVLSIYRLYAPDPGTPEAETLSALQPLLSD